MVEAPKNDESTFAQNLSYGETLGSRKNASGSSPEKPLRRLHPAGEAERGERDS